MWRKQYVWLLLIVFLASCTGKKYLAPNFDKITENHKRIAIMPFTVKYTGRIPLSLNAEDIATINLLVGKAFQQGLYNSILKEAGDSRKEVEIQLPSETIKKLQQTKGTTSALTPALYCEILGVDAVVFSEFTTEKLITDLEKYNISLPITLNAKLRADSTHLNNNLPIIPGNAERTFKTRLQNTINNKLENKQLWFYETHTEMKWSSTSTEIIERITEGVAKNFPYSINIKYSTQ